MTSRIKCLALAPVGWLLLLVATAKASLYTESFTSGMAIPDGSPVGMAAVGTVGDISTGQTVAGLTVGLNVSGGYNGDLYAYLVAPNGAIVLLLNQPGVAVNGFGASGAGMGDGSVNSFVLSDSGSTSIQSVTSGGVLMGTYSAAGSLSGFDGSAANGSWSLYFADLTSGGGTSTLDSWTLNISTSAVPEPVNMALGIFAGFAGIYGMFRWQFRRKLFSAAVNIMKFSSSWLTGTSMTKLTKCAKKSQRVS